ncbi:MAG: YkgJ family cysteine cluster protein, partial [Myxococcota bacterium]|nr:YkgJ family cysteine cluster protein [Myxococcota bacterium]
MQKPRTVEHSYDDPLSVVWLRTAETLKMQVHRTPETFASWDGESTLSLAPDRDLDEDDCLAQMILHEICHALVEGEDGQRSPDWGLENADDRDEVREFACLRLQASLAAPYGLRSFLAPTTDWRWYYDQLPHSPLGSTEDPATVLARAGYERAQKDPWRTALSEALTATRDLARITRDFADQRSLWSAASELHPTGQPLAGGDERCLTCAWIYQGGPGPRVPRCRQHQGARVQTEWGACDLWEQPLVEESCGSCGACCRDGYHLVEVPPRSVLARRHPSLVVFDQ